MNFTTYHSSCYRIETRTSKNSDELRAIEKALGWRMVKSETRRDAEILVRNPSPRPFGENF